MSTKKELVARVEALPEPPEGYKRWTKAKLEAFLEPAASAPEPEPEPTDEEAPGAVQVTETFTGNCRGMRRTFRRGTIYRGEVKDWLWAEHRDKVNGRRK